MLLCAAGLSYIKSGRPYVYTHRAVERETAHRYAAGMPRRRGRGYPRSDRRRRRRRSRGASAPVRVRVLPLWFGVAHVTRVEYGEKKTVSGKKKK